MKFSKIFILTVCALFVAACGGGTQQGGEEMNDSTAVEQPADTSASVSTPAPETTPTATTPPEAKQTVKPQDKQTGSTTSSSEPAPAQAKATGPLSGRGGIKPAVKVQPAGTQTSGNQTQPAVLPSRRQ